MMWNVIYDSDNKKSEMFEWGQSLVAPQCQTHKTWITKEKVETEHC